MAPDHASYISRSHFAGLDGVRAIAIVAVVWHHSAHPDFLPMFGRGFAGVDLFFVLSGFLITTLLLREKQKTGKISLRNFWMRRFLRLMPVYYLLLFGLLGAYLVFKPNDPDTTRFVEGFPVYALYLSNWFNPGVNNLGITWSLATEEQFYVLWPLVEAFIAPIVAGGFWLVALAVNQLINFGVFDSTINAAFGPGAAESEILDATFTPILLGVGLAHVLHREKSFTLVAKLTGFSNAPWVFFALLLALANIPAADISGLLRLSFHLCMTAWIASIVLAPKSSLTRGLTLRPVALIGAVSYGMYLYHLFCLHAARVLIDKAGLAQGWFEFPLGLTLTIITAIASFYLYEKRFLDFRKRFRK